MTADHVPQDEAARFMALANLGTAGAAATAGLLGPVMDWANKSAFGAGYSALFITAGLAFIVSALVLRNVTTPSESFNVVNSVNMDKYEV